MPPMGLSLSPSSPSTEFHQNRGLRLLSVPMRSLFPVLSNQDTNLSSQNATVDQTVCVWGVALQGPMPTWRGSSGCGEALAPLWAPGWPVLVFV